MFRRSAPNERRALGDDFRTFLSELVSALPQTGTLCHSSAALSPRRDLLVSPG